MISRIIPSEASLEFAEQIVRMSRLRAVTVVERSREASEGIIRLINEVKPDLLVVGLPPLYSTVQGLMGMIALETILRKAPCEVIISKMPG